MAFFQKPESGVTETSKMVRSLGLGKSMLATFPPSNSAMSARVCLEVYFWVSQCSCLIIILYFCLSPMTPSHSYTNE